MTEESYTFSKLTTIDNANISVYENAIKYVFENEDIKNVAISGAYGAGISSLLHIKRNIAITSSFIFR